MTNRKPIKQEKEVFVSETLLDALDKFLEFAPPGRLSRNLQKIFLLYLSHEQDSLPLNFNEIVIDLYGLFEFLETVEEEMRGRQGGE